MTHKELVILAGKWLTKRCQLVTLENKTIITYEYPDAIGWRYTGHSILIECKTSLQDFYKDKAKPFRRFPSLGMGQKRFFLTEAGLLTNKELPENWGLLEAKGKRVTIIKEATDFPGYEFSFHEQPLLIALVRRAQGEQHNIVKEKEKTYISK